jgi:hypothetical protein
MQRNHLNEFAENLRQAPSDKIAERIVRCMVEEVGKDCPVYLLVQLGQCIIDCRKSELRDEAARN